MISETFFHPLRDSINTLDLSQVKSTLAKCRKQYTDWLRKEKLLTTQEINTPSCVELSSHGVVESRDDNDLTVLMYACLLYHQKARVNDRMACRALDQIVSYLIEEGATVWAQAGRKLVRAGVRDGKPVYLRGEGRNIIEALGQRNLPPSVQAYIAAQNSEVYDRFNRRVCA